MKKYCLLLTCLPTLLFSQVYDDFSDGDFTSGTYWEGAAEKFRVNGNFQLQLNAADAGRAYLTTAFSSAGKTEWRCWVSMAFSPSSNNYARIYLVSDQQDLTLPLNGYFLQLGESGSLDAITLFRQAGTEITEICRGEAGLISSSFAIGVKVTRDETGYWQVMVDPEGGSLYLLQATGFDDSLDPAGYLGLYCQYTISNANRMYFDDIYAGPWIIDDQPPAVVKVTALSDTTLLVDFNEAVAESSAEHTGNYLVSGNIGNPVEAVLKAGRKAVELHFENRFTKGDSSYLQVTGIGDLSGNIMLPQVIPFLFYQAAPFDVVINEIMADPAPSQGLPEYEYVEMYNRTDFPLDLSDWVLVVGNSEKTLQGITLPAGDYLIIADEEAKTSLVGYGLFYGLNSLSLANAGQQLVLKDGDGTLISQVSYSVDWYKDPDKEEGGWSLEQINTGEYCSGETNWTASVHQAGGTPGSLNSVNSSASQPPGVAFVEVPDPQTLVLNFTQLMEEASAVLTDNYSIDKGIGHPVAVETDPVGPRSVRLLLPSTLKEGVIYHLLISKEVRNCSSEPLEKDTILAFGLPAQVQPGDLLINEILFNPMPGGSDYVEVYNNSASIVALGSIKLGTVKTDPPLPNDTLYYEVTEEQSLMLPATYRLLTSGPEVVKMQYAVDDPGAFMKVDPFPAYNNGEGTCILATLTGTVIDAFDYTEEMHHPLLNTVRGVSLERSFFSEQTKFPGNWHSAAEGAGFGTPGYQNSQHIPEVAAEEEIQVVPEIFSPDNDGYHDMTSIRYRFERAGYNMTVRIYTAEGYPVRHLVNNRYMGTEGAVNWDGLQDDHSPAPAGIYVIFIQVFDLAGRVKRFRKTAVLAGDR